MLSFDGVSKQFAGRDGGRHHALADVQVAVRRREFVALVGASGCGKSTLIRIAAGLEQATSGTVRVEGQAVSGPGPDRGMVFQQFSLFPWLTVKENIQFGLRSQAHSRATCEQIAAQWVSLVGLSNFAGHYPAQLSGGMQQRVAIARALAPSPRVLLMDEPFGALDPHTRARMQGYLLQIWANMDITVVFVTHDLEEAVLLADRVLVLAPNPGRVVAAVDIPLERRCGGRDRYDPVFKDIVAQIQGIASADQQQEDPPLDLFRLARVDEP
jgi:NitT/TauT family transport system ATP-binding protein